MPRDFVTRHPLAFIGAMVAAGILSGALVAWTIAQQRPTGPALHWVLASPGRPAEIANDATVVKITTDFWPACHPYDDETGPAANSSWLTPEVSYTPESVTITLRPSASYDPTCGHGSFYDYWGLPVEIHLSEPLDGRLLLDGSSSPPSARPYR